MIEPVAIAQGISHSPGVSYRHVSDGREDMLRAGFAESAAAFAAQRPDVVVIFGTDHFNGFFYEFMPPFCIGARSRGVGDWGMSTEALPDAADVAARLHRHLLARDFDIAVSYDMRLDHAFVQPLELLGLADHPAIVPIFINCAAPPRARLQRVVELGREIGGYFRKAGKRMAFIGSGGLSHEVPYPAIETAAGAHLTRILTRPVLSADERRVLEQGILKSAQAAMDSGATKAQLNPQWDHAVMRDVAAQKWSRLLAMTDEAVEAEAGCAAHEFRVWLAAFTALQVFGDYTTEQQLYAPMPEWFVGFGLLRASVPAAAQS